MAEAPLPPPPPPNASLPPRLLPSLRRLDLEEGNSPLHVACYQGAYDSALMLLLAGSPIEARNAQQQTPLHYCVSQGHLETMMLLLDSGSEVNSVDREGLTPLHQAVMHGNRDAVELLLAYGASVFNGPGVEGTRSALELAGHVHVCHRLVQDAVGRVWPLQHLCRVAIRRCLGARHRRRLKELPLPRHLFSFLSSLPVGRSLELHESWGRVRSSKSEGVRRRERGRRPKQPRLGGGVQLARDPGR